MIDCNGNQNHDSARLLHETIIISQNPTYIQSPASIPFQYRLAYYFSSRYSRA